MIDLESLPYQTPGFGGCGGRLKMRPEDFSVTELPLYEASGSGEHVYVEIEKTGWSTPHVIERIRAVTGLPGSAIGHAGLKDAQAVARQWFSLHCAQEPPLAALEAPGLRILQVTRHANKLRRGHLRGNRFAVRLRAVTLPPAWEELAGRVSAQGFPNYFGAQRLGPGGANVQRGRALLLRPPRRMQPERLRFLVNAYQAGLFNTLLARRLSEQGTLGQLLPGDLAVLHRNGASFRVGTEELASSQPRADSRELSPSAPLFGHQVPLAEGEPGRWERELLQQEQLSPESFRIGGKRDSPRGERRPVREFPEQLAWTVLPADDGSAGDDLRLEFTLPAGTYATSLLRELMKADPTVTPGSTQLDQEAVGDAH